MNHNTPYDDDFERDIVLQRIKEDEMLADLREEVDQFRRSQLEAEEKFFNEVAKDHPWFAEYARDAKELREEESLYIDDQRLGADYRIKEERLVDDNETAYREALEGNSKYLERIEHWQEKLNYDSRLPDIDPADKQYYSNFYHLPGDSRSDFRTPDFEFEHDARPDSFVNQYRLKSYEFWRSMNEKYPWDLVESELKANMIDPILDFRPRGLSKEDDIAFEAYSHHAEIEWRVVGDSREEERFLNEAERAYEDHMHHHEAQISEEREMIVLERHFLAPDADLLVCEDNPFMGHQIDNLPEQILSDDQVSINQHREHLEALYELTEDDICEIFQISPEEYEWYRTNSEDERDR